MKVLVACEFSQVVTEQFIIAGHDAMSVDLLDPEKGFPHYKGDIFKFIKEENFNADLLIGHPPCTYTAVSGNRWYAGTELRKQGIDFFKKIYNLPAKRKAIEHPVSVISKEFMKPSQYIQPYQFGEANIKKTGLWLVNLPKLIPTELVDKPPVDKNGFTEWYNKGWGMSPVERKKHRSRFSLGFAKAMVQQWGDLI